MPSLFNRTTRYSSKFNSNYTIRYNNDLILGPVDKWPAYMEITTWSGGGAFMKRVRGSYLYRPILISWPKLFYKPKYQEVINSTYIPRSTIHWEPNMVTENTGKATLTFYPSKKINACTVIIQGADLNGSVGYKCLKVKLK